jgi:hypothetical protein
VSVPLTKDDVRAIIVLLKRQQAQFWPKSWTHNRIDALITKLEAALPAGKGRVRLVS